MPRLWLNVALQPRRDRSLDLSENDTRAVGCKPMLGPLSPHDIEVFIVCRRLKVSRDHIEFRIGCPRRAGWQRRTALSQLTFTELIRGVDVVQFMLDVGAFEQIPKPLPLIPSVTREIEHNGYAAR